jgi:hypothetical protein
MLFPELSPDQAEARMDRAFLGARDDLRWQRIERLVHGRNLSERLLRRLREPREDPSDES